jgi:hypothetical protein
MTFVTKPDRVHPKELIKSDTINKIITGLEDIENYLESRLSYIIDHLEYGKVTNIPTNDNTVLTYDITFAKQFTNSPFIFLTIENLNPDVDLAIWVSNVTTTGFTLNVKIIKKKANTYVNVNWLALL